VEGTNRLGGGEAWIRIVRRCFSPCSEVSASFHMIEQGVAHPFRL
jgi:hypothetical protein